MVNNQNTYRRPVSRGWRERWMNRFGMNMSGPLRKDEMILPRWMVTGPMLTFFIAFAACSFMFGNNMPFEHALFASVTVVLFFIGARHMSTTWQRRKEKVFVRNLFLLALLLRLIWVICGYAFYNESIYGKIDGYGDDNGWYMEFAQGISEWMQADYKIPFGQLMKHYASSVDDAGYPVWLAILYWLSGESSDVFLPMIIKAIMSAYSCLCIYHIARRHFGEGTARIAGLFMCLNPYMFFWCATMLKETEMIFLCCVFVNETDKALSSPKGLTFMGLLPGMLAASALFFFRAPLAVICFLSIFTHVVFVSKRVMSAGKKVLAGVFVLAVLMVGMGDRIRTQTESIVQTVQSGGQQSNMEWRSNRKGGNAFAKYAGAAVFAPLIFTIPFPTFNMANEEQVMQLTMSGANYIKNILSFFVVIVLIMLLISGEWRRHVFILAFTLGYMAMLVLSNFAQSARFHMPVMPMLLLLAAYGVQIAKGNVMIKKGLNWALMIEVVACLAWNWFKLKGRGMI